MYDSRANRWRAVEPMLEVRSGAGVAIYKDHVIAAGGHNGPLVQSSVEVATFSVTCVRLEQSRL